MTLAIYRRVTAMKWIEKCLSQENSNQKTVVSFHVLRVVSNL